MLKIVHLITDLDTGGAEMMLYKLLSAIDRQRFASQVISLLPLGPVAEKISSLGIQVDTLNLERGIQGPLAFLRAVRALKKNRPDILQTWLYHADLLGLLAGRMAGIRKITWNLRCSNMELENYNRTTSLAIKACARLSRFPDAVITNACSAREFHKKLGYRARRFEVIPNGFDLDHFKPSNTKRQETREGLGLNDDSPCIGFVARFDPMKDHRTFIRAAGMVLEKMPLARFVLCGDGITPENDALAGYLLEAGIKGQVLLLDRRENVADIMACLDIAVSSSAYGEGFPNVVGEAMACGVPCVVTDVGDSADIVGDTGLVIRPKDADALAKAILKLLRLPERERKVLGDQARQRIADTFSLAAVVGQYESFYLDLKESGSA